MAPIDTVMLNLRDSVSRIVYNLGFTNIEVGAHAKLVGLLADKLEAISHTSRGLLENSGRQAKGLTPVDLKHVFRMNRIDIAGLRLYTESVAPFPPTKSEIHEEGPITRVKKKDRLVDKTGSKPVQTPLQKHPTPPVFKFPIFDDMTDEQLGFGCDEEELEVSTSFTTSSKPPATILEPPPPPPPIPPLFFSPPPFATSYPPFLAADSSFNSSGETWPNFGVNYTTPDLTPPGLSYQVFATDPPAASENQPTDEPQEPEKSRAKYRKSAQKLEKVSSSSSISSAKMTKKRLMQTNYERRLRNEQMANEERKKERKYEKRRAEKEQIEKVKSNVAIIKEKLAKRTEKKKEKPDDYMPSLVLKLKPGAYEAIRKLEHGAREAAVPDHSAKVSSSTDINDNKLIKVRPLKRKLEETVVPEKMVVPREPLPKMRISFRRLKHGDTGVLIKKILTTTYYESNGEWKASERQWKSSNGVYSKPLQPHRPIRLSSSKSRIPKLKLIKNADNSYSKV